MSASAPGPVRRFLFGFWRVVDVSRRVVFNLLFLFIVIAVIVALAKSGPGPIAEKTALILNIDGTIDEQKSGTLRSTALDQVRGEAVQKVLQDPNYRNKARYFQEVIAKTRCLDLAVEIIERISEESHRHEFSSVGR